MSKFITLAAATLAMVAACTGTTVAAPPAAAPPAGSTPAPTAKPSPALVQRAAQLVQLINGQTGPDQVFHPAFLAQVPAERLARIAGAVRSNYGSAIGVARIEAATPNSGTIYINLENSQVPIKLLLADQAPHLVTGMQF
jgi:hypothetical protein